MNRLVCGVRIECHDACLASRQHDREQELCMIVKVYVDEEMVVEEKSKVCEHLPRLHPVQKELRPRKGESFVAH